MADARLLHRRELVVGLDYSLFSLRTSATDLGLAQTLIEQAQDADGIAQSGGLLVVISPHQNNFAMPLTVEVWDSEPAEDPDDWPEAFEAHLDVTHGVVYESPTLDVTDIDVPAGSYHALITGRGFLARGWPGSTGPGDRWRIRLWPSAGPTRPRRLRAFQPARRVTEARVEDAGRAAARRICRDLQRGPDARMLSGQRGEITVEVILQGAPRRWASFLTDHGGWLTSGGGGDVHDARAGAEFWLYETKDDSIAGTYGQIVCRFLDHRHGQHTRLSWNWLVPPIPGQPASHPQLRRLLAHDTEVLMALTAVTSTDMEAERTQFRVTHAKVPAEWSADLADYWKWRLSLLPNYI